MGQTSPRLRKATGFRSMTKSEPRIPNNYNRGDRVEIDKPGAREGRSKTGTVVGYSADKTSIRVHWDGTKPKSGHTVHPQFLKRL